MPAAPNTRARSALSSAPPFLRTSRCSLLPWKEACSSCHRARGVKDSGTRTSVWPCCVCQVLHVTQAPSPVIRQQKPCLPPNPRGRTDHHADVSPAKCLAWDSTCLTAPFRRRGRLPGVNHSTDDIVKSRKISDRRHFTRLSAPAIGTWPLSPQGEVFLGCLKSAYVQVVFLLLLIPD
jgi:hypothetical protein